MSDPEDQDVDFPFLNFHLALFKENEADVETES